MNNNFLYVWCEQFKSEDLTKLLRGRNTPNPLEIMKRDTRFGHLDLAILSNPSILKTRIYHTPIHNYNNTHFVLGEVFINTTISGAPISPAIKIDIGQDHTFYQYILVTDEKPNAFEKTREKIVVPISRHPVLDFVDAYESLPQFHDTTLVISATPDRAKRLGLI